MKTPSHIVQQMNTKLHGVTYEYKNMPYPQMPNLPLPLIKTIENKRFIRSPKPTLSLSNLQINNIPIWLYSACYTWPAS